VLGRVVRLIWGGDLNPALRPVIAVSLVGSIAGSTMYPFLGIWAIRDLHASQGALAFAYLTGAVLSGGVGYLGGHTSDRVGRRPMILIGEGCTALVPIGHGGGQERGLRSGTLDRVIPMPVTHPTKCAFGGPDLADLYVTSASTALSAEERAAQPHAGSLFRLQPGVKGRPARPFAG